jgi:hypothetical protein
LGIDAAFLGLGMGDHPRFRDGGAELDRDARRGGDLELAGAGPQRRHAREIGCALQLAAAGDDE